MRAELAEPRARGTQPPQKLELSRPLSFFNTVREHINKILRLNRQQQMINVCVDFHMTRVSLSVFPCGGRSKFTF